MIKVLGILETVLKDYEDIENRGRACVYDTNDLRQAINTVKDYLGIEEGIIFRKVRIKTWKEMEKEFGLDEEGDINTLGSWLFIKNMEERLPNDRIIEIVIDEDGDNNWVGTKYYISKPMIAEYL